MAKQHNQAYRLYKRGSTYHAYISFIAATGERVQFRESTRTSSEQKAIEYCIKRISEIQKRAYQQETGELPCITLDEAFGRFYQENGQYQSSPKQILTRLKNLKHDLGVSYLHEINETVISNLVTKYRKLFKNATINRYLALLSVIINTADYEWHVKTYHIKISHFKLSEPAENIKFLRNWETVEKIINLAAPHLKPIIYTAIYTGFRPNNILKLKWENIDFINNQITIKVKDRTREGGKIHTKPLISQLRDILEIQPQINEYVFNFHGKPIKSITRAWHSIFYKFVPTDKITKDDVIENRRTKDGIKTYKRVLRDSSLPYTDFYTLRHTHATWMLKKTGNLLLVQKSMGHSNIKTTTKYTHALNEDIYNALLTTFD